MAGFDIFVAHAGADGVVARDLYRLLAGRCEVFLDSESIGLGDDWALALSRAQKQSRVTVVLVTDHTGRAYYEREEIQTAISMARNDPDAHRVVPVILDRDAELPYGLRGKHGLTLGDLSLPEIADRLVDLAARLRDEPAGAPPAAAVPRPRAEPGGVVVTGAQVDPLVTFVGRDAELRTLTGWLSDGRVRCVTVVGRAGIGKTALAAKVLQDLARGQDRAFTSFVSVSSRTRTREITAERIYLECCQLFGPRAAEAEQVWRSSVYSFPEKLEILTDRLAAGGRTLVLLDNFEDVLAAGRVADERLAALVDHVVAAPDGPKLLVTTREMFGIAPALEPLRRELDLGAGADGSGGLPAGDAVAMLRGLDPDGRAGLRDAPPEELRTLALAAGGVPRAIEILAGQERSSRLWGVEAVAPDRGIALAELVEEEHSRLDAPTRRVLEAVAGFGRPIDLAAIASVVGGSVDVPATVGLLLRRRLVKKTSAREVSAHPVDAEHAWRGVPDEGPWSKGVLDHRMAEYWASVAPPVREITTIAALEPRLLQYRHLTRAGDADAAGAVICACADFLVWRQGSMTRAQEMLAETEDRVADPGLRLRLTIVAATVLYFLGPVERSVPRLEWAVEEARRRGMRDAQAQALNLLGDAYRTLGDVARAVELLRLAVQADEDVESELGLQSSLHLGLAYLYGGDRPAAERTLADLSRRADAAGTALCGAQRANLRGALAAAAGHWVECADASLEAQRLYEQAGLQYAVGYVLNSAGLALLMLGNLTAARAHLELGRERSQAFEDVRAQALNLHNLAFLLRASEGVAAARVPAAAAERLLRRRDPGDTLPGDVLAALDAELAGDREEAAARYRRAAAATGTNADLYPAAELLRIAAELTASAPAAE